VVRRKPTRRELAAQTLSAIRVITSRSNYPGNSGLGIATDPETFQLTVKFIDRDGKPATDNPRALNLLSVVGDNAEDAPHFLSARGGQVSVRLPKSVYSLSGHISTLTPDGNRLANITAAGAPRVDLNKDTTITFDARRGTKATVRVDRPTATPVLREFGFLLNRGKAIVETGVGVPAGADLYGVPVDGDAADAPHFTSVHKLQLTSDGPFYNLGFSWPGKIPGSLALTVHDSDLGKVLAKFASKTDQRTVVGRVNFLWVPGQYFAGAGLTRVDQPGERMELVSPDPAASISLLFRDAAGREWAGLSLTTKVPADGRVVTQEWNRAVEGPGLPPSLTGPSLYAIHDATSIRTRVPFFADNGQGLISLTNPATVTGKLTLYRNGQEVGSTANVDDGVFKVPGEPANYQLTGVANRNAPWSQLSTHVESTWSFSSAAPTEPAVPYRPLPLLAVKFTPQLDEYNRAPADTRYLIPLRVERNAGGSQATVDDLSVQVSYDDGAHWQDADIESSDGQSPVALVEHPPLAETSGFVSLRVTAHNSDNNSLSHTVIRAYKLFDPGSRPR
jgi:hypothetical protein